MLCKCNVLHSKGVLNGILNELLKRKFLFLAANWEAIASINTSRRFGNRRQVRFNIPFAEIVIYGSEFSLIDFFLGSHSNSAKKNP